MTLDHITCRAAKQLGRASANLYEHDVGLSLLVGAINHYVLYPDAFKRTLLSRMERFGARLQQEIDNKQRG